MDFELWWLLPIPAVFFALGWIAARIDIKHLLRESRALPLSYFRGLNFLLNEQPDKAIESFIEVVKVDPQTIDLHFALGSLFRRQGEIDRAIRMHQNLLDRPDLPADKRTIATYELAQDFHRAGLLDRAEELFTKLERHDVRALGARASHLDLRNREGLDQGDRRDEADGGARASSRISRRSRNTIASSRRRRCCKSDYDDGDDRARRGVRDLSRLRARHAARRRRRRAARHAADAIAAWQKIETQNPAFLSLAADRFADAYRKLGDTAQGIRMLRNYQAQYPSLDLLNALFTLVLEQEGPDAAAALIKDELARNPDAARPRPVARGATARRAGGPAHDLELVKGLVAQHIKRLGMYNCDHCGFRAKQYYWRCPGCLRWETYSPRRTETPDGYA